MKLIAIRMPIVISLLTIATLTTQAQLPINLPHNWRPPQPVREFLVDEPQNKFGGQTDWDANGPFIKFNLAQIRNMPPAAILFLKAHEYGHVNLRHTRDRWSPAVAGRFEAEADCWAGQQLYASDPQILNTIVMMFERMGNTGGDWSHGTGLQMAAVIRACIQRAPDEPPPVNPIRDTISSGSTLEPLSITNNLKPRPCEIRSEDFVVPAARRGLIKKDYVREAIGNIRRNGESLVERINDDSLYREALEKEELANEKLEEANDYYEENGRRSAVRDSRVRETRSEARRAVRAANRGYREKVELCKEAVIAKSLLQSLVDEEVKAAAEEEKAATDPFINCKVDGRTVNLVGSTWVNTSNPGIVLTLVFGSNGNLSIIRTFTETAYSRTFGSTWVCTDSSFKIKTKYLSSQPDTEQEIEMGFDGMVLYWKAPTSPSGRSREFTRQN